MKTIHIEKYVDGIRQEELNLPVGPVRFLAGLLPNDMFRQLQQQGLDVEALLSEPNSSEAQWLDVTEGGVAKRIRVSCSG
jgi:hypothetical protein